MGPCNEKKRKKRKNDTERHQGESVVRQNAQGSRNGNCSTQLAREKEIVLHVLSRVRVNEDATTIGNSSPHDEDLEPCAGTFDWCALDEGAAAKRCPRTRLSSVVLCRLKQPNFSFHSFSSFPTKCDKKKNAQNTFDRVVIS